MAHEMAKKYDHTISEKHWAKQWQKETLYAFDKKSKKTPYVIDMPPPTVSGAMHAGHAFSYTQQDFIARYQRMKGNNVFYPFGTDDNGLPTERLVEKLKKVRSKKMDRADFVKLCAKTIKEIQPGFIQDWINLGMSCDFSTPYSTISPYCQQTSQASFIDLYNKGHIYRSETPISWCVSCQTAIAQAEFENQELKSSFNELTFMSGSKKLTIATTRPELLPACVALFHHPDDKRYKGFKDQFATVPLFDYEVPILTDESVDKEKGTGLMMVCTFGDKEDVEKWHKHHLELRVIFNNNGTLNDLAGPYKELRINEARKAIIKDLQEKKIITKQETIKHPVNVHDKCGTEVEYLKTFQWYVRVLDKKRELLKAADEITWYPAHMKTRYVHWVENLNWDWCISRQRHFGVPFPVWFEKDTGKIILADPSELPLDPEQTTPKKYKGDPKNLIPEQDVMDTWATSSVSPEIILDWVGKGGYDVGFKHHPCSLRPQAHDIIRTWAFYTVVQSLYHHKKIPWNNILISGHVLAADGKKFSKSKGNYSSPQDILKQYGADALRLWAGTAKLGDDLRYREEDIKNGQKTITKLWNASKFVFMHLDDYTLPKKHDHTTLETMDKWLLLKLNKAINNATQAFDGYEFSQAKREVDHFFWITLCDNYLEIAKDRLYNPKERGTKTRESAQFTLTTAMMAVLKMYAPLAPFITEEIHHQYHKESKTHGSLHTSSWPVIDPDYDDAKLEALGDLFIEVLADVRKYKSEQGKSLSTEVKLTLPKKDMGLLQSCIGDLQATCKATITSGKSFAVSL